MTIWCRNCDYPIDDYASCWHCEDAYQELMNRLRLTDSAATMMQVASWAMFGIEQGKTRPCDND